MGASNTPIYDLIELGSIGDNRIFRTDHTGGGSILGYVDNALYTDTENNNSATNITELNESGDADYGRIYIDGMLYHFELYTPTNTSNPVTVTYNGGASTRNLTGDAGTSQVAFIIAQPQGPGAVRYFMAVDDTVGDLPGIIQIQTRGIDWDPAGDDVKINLDQNNLITVCFAAGTMIATDKGPRPVERIAVGDRVATVDRGFCPVVWRHEQCVDLTGAGAHLAPIRIRRGALGPGVPLRDLRVSPQHRMLLRSKIVERVFGVPEILVPAAKLAGLARISVEDGLETVSYHHLYMGHHALLLAEGAVTESLLPETMALAAIEPAAQAELERLLEGPVTPARPIVDAGKALAELLRRHRRNGKPLAAVAEASLVVAEAAAIPALRLVAG